MSVTKSNCVEYIHLMAHYRLNVQLHRQFQAFRGGLQSVIPSHWLSLFSQNELQVLISGAQVPIDVQDLRLNTTYSGMQRFPSFSHPHSPHFVLSYIPPFLNPYMVIPPSFLYLPFFP